ncbi:isohexenylglutaconyl-CoA hydratase [Microbulbifer donghaiensis]|uniref:Isohexenylglutaconyl-CoA hydratase n=1 Tax=Microbulbifer donghaiensis TaxID=494016 RepID=A0A1M4VPA0_9GAMM|nr:enoyl-CoA hydratase-related protein [Microbulbifer donghaiensis]SHE70705.1 isohexenylglutaconyl-CoA hydratase [Microbulbifer donghaiensis]
MQTIISEKRGIAQIVTLNRPEQRNAISLQMVDELLQQLAEAERDPDLRALVVRGAGGNFCAGGDIGDMLAAQQSAADGGSDAFYRLNRRFGELLEHFNRTPLVVIAALEGAVMGGGVGLACIADITIAESNTTISLPETRLGLPPAQIAPFVVRRIGLAQARRLALSAARIDAQLALALGLTHQVAEGTEALDRALEKQLQAIAGCAPNALAATKQLMLASANLRGDEDLGRLLDRGAELFAAAVQGHEGREGARAFIEKRAPEWQY